MISALLADNLREIYASCKCRRALVPNLAGNRVYLSTVGWGRLWKWFFDLFGFLLGPHGREAKLKSALLKTKNLFEKQFTKLQPHLENYKEYLRQKSIGVILKEKKYHLSRRKITKWNRATLPLILLKREQYAFTHIPEKKVQRLTVYQQLIDLEGYLHAPLPLDLFKKLCMGKRLNDKEGEKMIEWVQEMRQKSSPIAIHPFHLALKAFVKILKNKQFAINTPPDLMRLEMQLLNLGLKVFLEVDPIHQKWRKSLQTNNQVERFTLGEKLESESHHTSHFLLQNHPDKVIVFGQNQAILALKKRLADEKGWCLHSPHCFMISETGQFAIYEKLKGFFEDHAWDKSKERLDNSDRDLLIPLQNMLKWMVDHNLCPDQLDIKFLKFNEKGILKYSKVCLPARFNYTAIEDFVFDCSKGNKIVFSHLIEHAGLLKHKYYSYYLRMVKSALNDENMEHIAAFEDANDPKVEDRGKELYQTIVEMRENLLKNTQVETFVYNVEKLEACIKQAILAMYVQEKLLGKLWPGTEQNILNRVLKTLQLKKRKRG